MYFDCMPFRSIISILSDGHFILNLQLLSTKEKRAMEDAKQELSSHFMNTLPDLISKAYTNTLCIII